MTPNPIPFFKPLISEAAIRDVERVMRSGWLTTGRYAKEFETAFAKYVKADYALALNSCTAALHLALDAIGLKQGEEVLLPTNTFAASAEVVEYFNAKPVLCDVRRDTQNIDEKKIERLLTRRTRAIMPVHFGGHPCEMDAILKIARKHTLYVIEDAAHCTPAYFKGKPIGTFGDITCFSFYANKCITTGEGGMAITDNRKYHERMKMMSLHGLSKDAWNRYDKRGSWYYEIVDRGFKYNMTDVAAALGIHQLKEANRLWKLRREAVARYHRLLKGVPGLLLPIELPHVKNSWHLYSMRVTSAKTGRDEIIQRLTDAGVKTSVHFIPLHLHPFYRNKYGYMPADFPVANTSFEQSVTLPLFPGMTPAQQVRVAGVIRDALA
ncbi:MAG: DegT/DnrJ/EryC1/StrS family aminotransferase [Fibrobacterota bacterium]